MKETVEQKREKGFADALAETPGERIAHAISVIGNPLFVALPLFLLVAWQTAPDVPHALLWWVITSVGVTGVPFFFIRRGVRRGTYTDDHVSVREQRLIPLSVGLAGMVLVFLFLILLHVARPFIATLTSALVALALAIAVTQFARYKISLHMVGITGAITICSLLLSPLFLILSPLVLLVGWARWKVHAHTPLQACLGVVLAMIVTFATLWLFGIW